MTENTNTPALVIEFGDERGEFAAHRYANKMALARHTEANRKGDYDEVLASLINVAVQQVKQEERARLEEFLTENGLDEEFETKIIEGLTALWKGETSIPKEKPSSDSSTSTGSTDSSSTELSSDKDTEEEVPKKPKKKTASSQA
jgi:hypothetical protein